MASTENTVDELSTNDEDLEIISENIQVKCEGNQGSQNETSTSSQKILEKKKLVHSWSQQKKLQMLATYSSCKAEDSCKCLAWECDKQMNEETINDPISMDEPCNTCSHSLECHIKHLKEASDSDLNKLLYIAVDIDNLYFIISREKDADTKQVYTYLFKLLRKCIATMSEPIIDGPLGKPPFDKPSIQTLVKNFLHYKYGYLGTEEFDVIKEFAKTYLNFINAWKLPTPSQFSSEENLVYKLNYTRWMCFCYVPKICESLPAKTTMSAFGKTLLRDVHYIVCNDILEKFKDRKAPFLQHFMTFAKALGDEIVLDSSPIINANLSSLSHQSPSNVEANLDKPLSESQGGSPMNEGDKDDKINRPSLVSEIKQLEKRSRSNSPITAMKKVKLDKESCGKVVEEVTINDDCNEITSNILNPSDKTDILLKHKKSRNKTKKTRESISLHSNESKQENPQNSNLVSSSQKSINKENDFKIESVDLKQVDEDESEEPFESDPLDIQNTSNSNFATENDQESVVSDAQADCSTPLLENMDDSEALKIVEAREVVAVNASGEVVNRRCELGKCRAMITLGDPHIICTTHRNCGDNCAACSLISRDPDLIKKMEYNEKKRQLRLKKKALNAAHVSFGSSKSKLKGPRSKSKMAQSSVFNDTYDDDQFLADNSEKGEENLDNLYGLGGLLSASMNDAHGGGNASRCVICNMLITKEDPHLTCLDHRNCDSSCVYCYTLAHDLELKKRVERRDKDKFFKLKRIKQSAVGKNDKSASSPKKSLVSSSFLSDKNEKDSSSMDSIPVSLQSSMHDQFISKYGSSILSFGRVSGSASPDVSNEHNKKEEAVAAILSLIKKSPVPSSSNSNSNRNMEQRIADILKTANMQRVNELKMGSYNSDEMLSDNSRSSSPTSVVSGSPSPSMSAPYKEISSMEGQLYLLNKRLSKTLPDFFEKEKSEDSILSFSSSDKDSAVLIVGTETLEKTWLANPPVDMASPADPRMWDSTVNLPTSYLTPKRAAVFNEFPCCKFDNAKWGKFLSEPPRKTVNLDGELSDKTLVSLNKANEYILAEAHGRTAIKAGSISDTYARIAEALIEKVRNGDKDPLQVIDQLGDAIRASRIMGIKAIAAESATVANLRMGLRNHVMEGLSCKSSKTSQCLLRGQYGHADFMGPMHSVLASDAAANPNLKLKRKNKPIVDTHPKPDSQSSGNVESNVPLPSSVNLPSTSIFNSLSMSQTPPLPLHHQQLELLKLQAMTENSPLFRWSSD